MNTIIQTARETVIAALAQDLANSYTGDRDDSHLVSFLRRGFSGFDNMTLAELRQAACDAGMDRRLAEHLAVLEDAEIELAGPDFTVTVEVSVTADSAEQALNHALDDLSDPELRHSWSGRVKDVQAKVSVDVDASDLDC
ncbi:hypothetical protein [Methylibium petroleiphilum]|uniref:Uncharacterized protein n=1 Tax=Methylibium petroleiphilum (strain ATCC BAA-1232 / LMG 22953 / PM1) TaxID=420662 RepID=A2SNG8_METPP|nr:hypothetical protein [Methylibium petroleiphilum]ABM97107.1 hypothetical protein Mpe_B0332 [Methylibium petroleiphilum PM1]